MNRERQQDGRTRIPEPSVPPDDADELADAERESYRDPTASDPRTDELEEIDLFERSQRMYQRSVFLPWLRRLIGFSVLSAFLLVLADGFGWLDVPAESLTRYITGAFGIVLSAGAAIAWLFPKN